MTDKDREELSKALKRDGLKQERDKKYAHQVYMELGMMTKKGNLTRAWQQYRKLTGWVPRHYAAIRKELGLS